MVITGILQVRNEESSGHLARFLEWNLPIYDHLIAFDDDSTDQTVSLLLSHGIEVIKGGFHAFRSELHIKQELLSTALSMYPNTDWFLWLDADELLLESRENLEVLLMHSEKLGYDGIGLPLVNLWRSQNMYRIDSGFNDLTNVRFWKNTGNLRFKTKPGLHHLMHPRGLKCIRKLESLRVLHFGFASDAYVLSKFHTYQQSGQRGRNLWRLVDETKLSLQEISTLSKYLGSRYRAFADFSGTVSNRNGSGKLLQDCRFDTKRKGSHKPPLITLISLIYAGVDWLEFQYGELLKLQRELGSDVVEILFVANDASGEVIEFLTRNFIPYVCAPGKTHVDEWYINSVYRAYNYGVQCAKGEYVVLTNSDMAYSPGFLLELVKNRSSRTYLVAKLIESGRLTPAKAAISKNLGKKLSSFKRAKFYSLAEKFGEIGTSPGGLYMPVILSREHFLYAGGYPEGNLVPQSLESYVKTGSYVLALQGDPVIPGDYAFVKRLEADGWQHETLKSAIAYHFQEGEKSEVKASLRSKVASGILVDGTKSPLLHKIEELFSSGDWEDSRLNISDRFQTNGTGYGLVIEDSQDFFSILDKELIGLRFCITSNEEMVRRFSIDFDIHTYFLDNWSSQNSEDFWRLVKRILVQELHNTFMPIEPVSIREKVTKGIPPALKLFIKSLLPAR